MKALIAPGLGRLEVGDVPAPEVRAGHALVRTEISAVSAGTERRKLYVEELGPRDLRDPWPAIGAFGYMAAGVVLEVAPDVTGLAAGDRVYAGRAWGGHREILDVPAGSILALPAGLSFLDGACAYWAVPPLLGLLAAEPVFNEDAAVVGLGPLGLAAVQLLTPVARRVVAIDPVPLRRGWAEDHGAIGIDPLAGDSVLDRVREVMPDGPDIVLEVSGTQRGLETALEIVRPKGRIALVGSQKPLHGFDLFWPLQHSGARIVPLFRPGMGSLQVPGPDHPMRRYLPDVFEMIGRGRIDIRSLANWVVEPEDAPAAFDLLHRRPDLGIGLAISWTGRVEPGASAFQRALAADAHA